MELVRQGKVDILGFYLGDEVDSLKQKMVLTAPFASMNSIIVRNKASGFPGSELVGAVIEGRELPKSIRAAEVKSYRNINAVSYTHLDVYKRQIEGMELENVQFVKLFQNAQDVIERLKDESVKRVAVVGAGYIGVELAEAFKRNGREVDVYKRQYLSTTFKKKYGIGIAQYINSLRIEKAKRLIVNTDENIKEIALSLSLIHIWFYRSRWVQAV